MGGAALCRMGYTLFCSLSNINEIQDSRGFQQAEKQETLFCT